MRTRTFKLTEPEVGALKQAEQQAKRPDERRRMQAVRLFGTGMDKQQIMEITGFSERNLQRLASCFRHPAGSVDLSLGQPFGAGMGDRSISGDDR